MRRMTQLATAGVSPATAQINSIVHSTPAPTPTTPSPLAPSPPSTIMSNIKSPSALSQPSLARNPSLQAIRNRSNSQSIPIPPSLLDKPYLQAVTLPPTSSPYRNLPTSHQNPSRSSTTFTYGHIGAKEDTWLRDTIPAAYDTGDTSNSPSRVRSTTHLSAREKHVPIRCLTDSLNYPPHNSSAAGAVRHPKS